MTWSSECCRLACATLSIGAVMTLAGGGASVIPEGGDVGPPATVAQFKPQINAHTIRLKATEFDPLIGDPEIAEHERIAEFPTDVRDAYLVQFDRPITDQHRAALTATGASIKGSVPMMALEVVMTGGAAAAVSLIQDVRWVGVYHPTFKVHPQLRASDRAANAHRIQVPGISGGWRTPGLALSDSQLPRVSVRRRVTNTLNRVESPDSTWVGTFPRDPTLGCRCLLTFETGDLSAGDPGYPRRK